MIVYLDADCRCHAEPAEGLQAVEMDFFDGRCRRFVEGYRYVPAGARRTGPDGTVFPGPMLSPAENHAVLAAVQQQYEESTTELMTELNDAFEKGVNSV